MNFIQAVKFCLTTKLLDYKTRASRSEFWWFYLFIALWAIIWISLGWLTKINMFFLIGGLGTAALLIPLYMVGIRRMHDIGKSGWWFGLPMLISRGVSRVTESDAVYITTGEILAIVVSLICTAILVYLLTKKGDIGENQYGTNPLEAANLPK